MPTYEYVCDHCRRQLEIFQKMSDRPLRKCPDCGKNRLRRKIGTGAGIIFKGSGFYCNDYRSENYRKTSEKESRPEVPATGKKEEKPSTPAKTDKTAAPAAKK